MNGPRSCCLLNFNPQNLLFRNCCHRSFSEEVAFCLSSLLFNNDIVVIVFFVCFIVFPSPNLPQRGRDISMNAPKGEGFGSVSFALTRVNKSLSAGQSHSLRYRVPATFWCLALCDPPRQVFEGVSPRCALRLPSAPRGRAADYRRCYA